MRSLYRSQTIMQVLIVLVSACVLLFGCVNTQNKSDKPVDNAVALITPQKIQADLQHVQADIKAFAAGINPVLQSATPVADAVETIISPQSAPATVALTNAISTALQEANNLVIAVPDAKVTVQGQTPVLTSSASSAPPAQ